MKDVEAAELGQSCKKKRRNFLSSNLHDYIKVKRCRVKAKKCNKSNNNLDYDILYKDFKKPLLIFSKPNQIYTKLKSSTTIGSSSSSPLSI